MKMSDFKDKTLAELRDEEQRLRKELFDLRFNHGTRRLMDTASLKRTKRDIARVMTAIQQQQRAQTNA
jgi:large subunit ribosomal protein L29